MLLLPVQRSLHLCRRCVDPYDMHMKLRTHLCSYVNMLHDVCFYL